MNVVRLAVITTTFWVAVHGRVIKYGELVEPSGYFTQNGVALLEHRIPFNGVLFGIRAGVASPRPVWIQAWRQLEYSGIQMNFTLTAQWKYTPTTAGVVSFNITPPIAIEAGQLIGVFLPAAYPCPLTTHEVSPRFPLYGSDYITRPAVSLGDVVRFGYIGYRYKISIQYSVYTDQELPVSTNSGADVVTSSAAASSLSTTQKENNTQTKYTTAGLFPAASSQSSSVPSLVVVLVAVGVSVALLAIIIGTAIYFYRRKREITRNFISTSNPVYNTPIDHDNWAQHQQTAREIRGDQTRAASGIYSELDEKQMT